MLLPDGSLEPGKNTPGEQSLFDSEVSHDALFEVDMNGNFLTVPSTLEKITGFSREELDRLSLNNVTFTEDREKVASSIESIKGGVPFVVSEIEMFSESRGSHPVELILLPLVQDGEISGMWGTIKDITQRKNLENELKATKEMQEASQMFLTDFVSLLTREIRQPLTTILLTLEMLDSGSYGDLNDVQGDKVSQLIEIIDKLKGTLNDALDMSRNIDEETKLDRRMVSMESLIKEIVKLRSEMVKDQGIKIIANFQNGDVNAEIDRKAISQVISTLIDRAISDSPQKGHVTLEVEDKGPDVVISISDSGDGIQESELEHLFDKLHLEQKRESKNFIDGMNLYITKRIVERHGGRIWCESFVGLGSTCFFVIPKVQEKEV